MRRLVSPQFDSWTATTNAAAKFAGSAIEQRIHAAECAFRFTYAEFETANQTHSWHLLTSCEHGQGDQLIVADLTKDELRTLYSDGIVKGVADARDIYDQIKVAAEGKCPYCGGIGDVDPLDHYMPKARYPQYSVVPSNLVPSCDRCNKLSGSSVVEEYRSLTLNPYFDHEKFFIESWVSVEFAEQDILSYLYVFDPPDQWGDDEKARARNHFDTFLLAERYAATASSEVSYLADGFVDVMAGVNDPATVESLFSSKANSQSFTLNGWQRPLYRSLSGADWYLAQFA